MATVKINGERFEVVGRGGKGLPRVGERCHGLGEQCEGCGFALDAEAPAIFRGSHIECPECGTTYPVTR